MNAGTRLTKAQGERIELVLRELAKRGNQAAIGIVASLDRANGEHRSADEKLELINGFYVTLFECLSVMQMAANSDAPIKKIEAELKRQRREAQGR